MQSLTRNNHITSNHLPLLLFTTSKNISIRTFSIAALFSYSNVNIAVYTRTTSLCNLASKIQGSRARSDTYEQTRRIFTLPSRKRLKEQPNQPLFLMLSISLKFECLRSASVGAKRTSTGCPAPSFVVWFTVTPFRIFIPQRNQVLLHPVRFDSSMEFVVVYFCNTVILNGIKKILSIDDYMCKSSCYLVFFIKS